MRHTILDWSGPFLGTLAVTGTLLLPACQQDEVAEAVAPESASFDEFTMSNFVVVEVQQVDSLAKAMLRRRNENGGAFNPPFSTLKVPLESGESLVISDEACSNRELHFGDERVDGARHRVYRSGRHEAVSSGEHPLSPVRDE